MRAWRKWRGTILAGFAGLAVTATGAISLSGCSVVKPPDRPTWRIFALEASPPTSASRVAPAPTGPVVVVATPESGAGYQTRRMAYSENNGEIAYFASHRWADTPASMIAPLLGDALTATGAFRAVAVAPTRVNAQVMVESEVLWFRQDVTADAAEFRAALRVTVLGFTDTDDTRSREFRVTEPMEGPGPVPGAAAANRAVARLVRDAAGFCAGR